MGRFLLTFFSALCITLSYAQSTVETAVDLVVGDNIFGEAGGEEYVPYYGKYTPAEDCVVAFAPSSGAYMTKGMVVVKNTGTGVNDTLDCRQMSMYPETGYAVKAGQTLIAVMSGYGQVTLKVSVRPVTEFGKGMSADDVLTLVSGANHLVGDITDGGESVCYATYTPESDGILVIKSSGSLRYTLNGGEEETFDYKDNIFRKIIKVEGGKKYDFVFTTYLLNLIEPVLTHPQPGDIDNPIQLSDGEFSVPAKAGQYWYTYTNLKGGTATLASADAMKKGIVKVYSRYSDINYDTPSVKSDSTSYNVSFEMKDLGQTYYICIDKLADDDAAQTFNFKFEPYPQGSVESNPLMITSFPADLTTPDGFKDAYYRIDLAAGEAKMLTVEITSELTATGAYISVYEGDREYSDTRDPKKVVMEIAGGTEGKYYTIALKDMAEADRPVSFTVKAEDIAEGDVIGKAIEAVKGENAIPGTGTKYYKYTATRTGKFMVTPTADAVATFPKGTGKWDGTYTCTLKGKTYYIQAEQGKVYYIKLEGVTEGEKFTLAEEDFAEGETRETAIEAAEGKYTFGKEVAVNLWVKYTTKRDGVLDIVSDANYNANTTMLWSKADEIYTTVMQATEKVDGISVTLYKATMPMDVAGITYYVNVQAKYTLEGKTISFIERDPQAGEAATAPLVVTGGEDVKFPAATATKPAWVAIDLIAGELKMVSDQSIATEWYASLDDALAGKSEYVEWEFSRDNVTHMPVYVVNKTISKAGRYYMKVTSNSYDANIDISGSALPNSSLPAAKELAEGENAVGDETGDMQTEAWWKYTAKEPTLVNATLIGGADAVTAKEIYEDVIDGTIDTLDVHVAQMNGIYMVPVMKGKTVYICVKGKGKVGVSAMFNGCPGLGTGSSEVDALEIMLDTVQYIGDRFNTQGDMSMYATYTAAADGQLTITASDNVTGVKADGGEMETLTAGAGAYIYTKQVVKGQAYLFEFVGPKPFAFTAEFGKVDAISSAGADGGSLFTLAGGKLSVSGANADVAVYTISGVRVQADKVAGGSSFSLKQGSYIVCINGKATKIQVR